jgi:hypothetical protein
MSLFSMSLLLIVALSASGAMGRSDDDEHEDAAEVVATWSFKICKEGLKQVKDDGTVWHWTKFLCNDVQEQTEEYIKEMVRCRDDWRIDVIT